jgi:type I restriction enzyme R subunit
LNGWRPPKGFKDKFGNPVEDRIYNRTDFEKLLVIEERRKQVAKKITEFLKAHDRFDKTIVFCADIEHAGGLRTALANENTDLMARNSKYVMQITGDNEEGKRELDNFTNPEERYPVIATTSKLMTTGIDAQTCKLIVLDCNIKSMTEFKQIIGRGTRINEEYGKTHFTIMDFRNVTDLFADPDFDGEPVRVKEIGENDPVGFPEEEEDETPVVDEEGDEIIFDVPNILDAGEVMDSGSLYQKTYVNGVNVTVLHERVQFLDEEGKLITGSLKDYTKRKVKEEFASLDDFLNRWNSAEKKQAVIEELEANGIIYENFKEEIGKEMDIFDMILHCAYDMPPLTRKERAEQVKKRNYFAKYGEKARAVLETLLEKYADDGIENIESLSVLKVQPFDKFGSPLEIISLFGGKENYLNAIAELEEALYKAA